MSSRISGPLTTSWCTLSAFLALVYLCPSNAAGVDPSLAAPIAEHMKEEFYNETDAEKKVAEWGDGCVPILIQMLNASTGEAEKIAFYLGKTRSPSAVRPLIEYVERLLAAGSERGFGYLALGWIGDEKGLEYLAQAARDPRRSELAIHGLEVAGNRKALAILKGLDSTLGASRPKYLTYAIIHCQETSERTEGLLRARSVERSNAKGLSKFWSLQGAQLSRKPAEEIIGEYVGTAFWTDYFSDKKIEGVRIIFREDGLFETNLALLTNMKRLDMRDPAPKLVKDFAQGHYRVLGPTQLALGPGKGVTTFGFSLGHGHVSFFHRRLGAFFSLGKNADTTQVFSATDIAGVYRGLAFVAEEGSSRIEEVGDVEIMFSDNGYFNTNFGNKYGKLMRGFNSFDGNYLIDEYGKLVCYAKVHGGDFVGGDAVSFFDWHFQREVLHVNHFQGAYYGCALLLSPSADAIRMQNDEALNKLTNGIYVGSGFRSTPEGQIVEFPGIELRFSEDGTYSSNFRSVLRPKRQYHPSDEGAFCLLSNRQLYMADKWDGHRLTNQGISDVLVSGDELFFTSFKRDAYFMLKKKTE